MKLRTIAGWLVAGLFAVGVALAGPGAVATASPAAQTAESGVLSHCPEINKHPIIGFGSTNTAVKHAQCLLVKHYGQNIAVDGIFGPATRQAVLNVQTICGLKRDGIVGPDTWAVLHKHGTC